MLTPQHFTHSMISWEPGFCAFGASVPSVRALIPNTPRTFWGFILLCHRSVEFKNSDQKQQCNTCHTSSQGNRVSDTCGCSQVTIKTACGSWLAGYATWLSKSGNSPLSLIILPEHRMTLRQSEEWVQFLWSHRGTSSGYRWSINGG